MEQQPENVIPPLTSFNIVSSPVPTNIVAPSSPTNINPPSVLTNIAGPPIPINTVPFVSSIPLQSMSQMPPLGPAPVQLPPLVHPPPPGVQLQSVINTNATIQETKFESIIPVQIQFETLNLNTPLELIAPLSIINDSAQINNELNTSQELVDGNSIALPPIDANETFNPNNDSLLVPEEAKYGMYSK
jgi:hypothetical protein